MRPEQHFTEPPPRYNEATLVKRLEADGVGPAFHLCDHPFHDSGARIRQQGKRPLHPPPKLGMVVIDLLLESFDDIFDVNYTARHGAGGWTTSRMASWIGRTGDGRVFTSASIRTSSTPKST